MAEARYVIVGTAGHIDHGKTSLVYALTGKHTDRLKEEQTRGISIDIDFAPLRFDDGLLIGMVDVPGHERFIRNMLAGAAGIDAALLTVDVNEGVKPQTLEHLAILQMLGVSSLVIALTKCDLADEEWILLAREVLQETLQGTPYEGAPVIATSTVTGQGLTELKMALHQLALDTPVRDAGGAFRLPVDKVFSIPGFGTVVSGTVWRGTVAVGDHLESLPGRKPVRVRGIQSHGKPVNTALAGQRAALNLVGVGHDEVHRGHAIAAPGTLIETRIVDVHLGVVAGHEAGLVHRSRVHVHLGTAQTVGRVLLLEEDVIEAGSSAYAQLLLEHPLVCEAGDHFVLRSYSPVTTVGGGRIVDPSPARLYRRKRPQVIAELKSRDGASPLERVTRLCQVAPISTAAIASHLGYTVEEAQALTLQGVESGRLMEVPGGWLAYEAVERLLEASLAALTEAHRKHRFRNWLARRDVISPRLNALTSRDLDFIFQEGVRRSLWDLQSGMIRISGWEVSLSAEEQTMYADMLERLKHAGIEGMLRTELVSAYPKRDRVADALLHFAVESNDAVSLGEGVMLERSVFDETVRQIRVLSDTVESFTVAQVRDLLHTSRRPTLVLLEALDAFGITVRIGDARQFVK